MLCEQPPCPCPTNSTLKPYQHCPSLILGLCPRSWCCQSACLPTEGLAHSAVRHSSFWGHLRDSGPLVPPGAGQGSLGLLAAEWVGKASPWGPAPACPAPHSAALVCSLCTSPTSTPPTLTRVQSQALPQCLRLSDWVYNSSRVAGVARQLLPKPSKMRKQTRGIEDMVIGC